MAVGAGGADTACVLLAGTWRLGASRARVSAVARHDRTRVTTRHLLLAHRTYAPAPLVLLSRILFFFFIFILGPQSPLWRRVGAAKQGAAALAEAARGKCGRCDGTIIAGLTEGRREKKGVCGLARELSPM